MTCDASNGLPTGFGAITFACEKPVGHEGRHHAELDLYGDEVPAEGDWLTLHGELNVEWGGGA